MGYRKETGYTPTPTLHLRATRDPHPSRSRVEHSNRLPADPAAAYTCLISYLQLPKSSSASHTSPSCTPIELQAILERDRQGPSGFSPFPRLESRLPHTKSSNPLLSGDPWPPVHWISHTRTIVPLSLLSQGTAGVAADTQVVAVLASRAIYSRETLEIQDRYKHGTDRSSGLSLQIVAPLTSTVRYSY